MPLGVNWAMVAEVRSPESIVRFLFPMETVIGCDIGFLPSPTAAQAGGCAGVGVLPKS